MILWQRSSLVLKVGVIQQKGPPHSPSCFWKPYIPWLFRPRTKRRADFLASRKSQRNFMSHVHHTCDMLNSCFDSWMLGGSQLRHWNTDSPEFICVSICQLTTSTNEKYQSKKATNSIYRFGCSWISWISWHSSSISIFGLQGILGKSSTQHHQSKSTSRSRSYLVEGEESSEDFRKASCFWKN